VPSGLDLMGLAYINVSLGRPTPSDGTHRCWLTTMRSCVGSMVRSAIEKDSLCDIVGIDGVSRSGSSADGKGMRRTEIGCSVRQREDQPEYS